MLLLVALTSLACAGTAPPTAREPEPTDKAAPEDTATPKEAPVDSPEKAGIRAHAAQSLGVDPDTLTVGRSSTRSSVDAWRAYVQGQSRGPGAKALGVVLDGEDLLVGAAGFATWVERHGRQDAVATAIAHHTLVHNATAEPQGSWTRGKSYADPAYNQRDQLFYSYPHRMKGNPMQATLSFAEDGTVTEDTAPLRVSSPPPRRGPPKR